MSLLMIKLKLKIYHTLTQILKSPFLIILVTKLKRQCSRNNWFKRFWKKYFIDLLMGILEPKSGKIYIDEIDIRKIKKKLAK